MHKNIFREKLETIIGDISLDDVKSALEKLVASQKNQEENQEMVRSFLDEVGFKGIFQLHPLVGRIIAIGIWGRIANKYQKTHTYKRIKEKLSEILRRQRVEEEDIREIRDLLIELRKMAVDFIDEKIVGNVKQGLRHVHAPGSVAKGEARNLYFGEKFTDDDLYRLASRLCSSIAFGGYTGIYSEDEDFIRNLKQLIVSFGFGPPFKIEENRLREIGIREDDLDHPYIVFLKFVMWLKNQICIDVDPEKRKVCSSILNMLQSATISVFFMPPNREKWCTISFPRLDFFINNWIQDDEARKRLEALAENIDNFIKITRREARKRKELDKVENIISLLMNDYEMLCRKLIEQGASDFHALRSIMDLIIDLSARYSIKEFRFKSLVLEA
ncbi:MAG: hypothetical protein QXR17_08535 [Candidatus Bathyarchaeia archaeon]